MRKKKTTEEIIKTANQIHNFKYDYSKTEYINIKQKICIICHEKDEFGEEHGEFWQTPDNHINGKQGCPKCAKNVNFTTDKFIKKSKLIHDNKYDYSKVKYINNHTLITIICNKHGEFNQLPSNHLKGEGCYKCGRESSGNSRKISIEKSIEKAKLIHNNKYNYEYVNYNKISDKVIIICPDHGKFEQTMHNHLRGTGCPKCCQSKGEQQITKLLLEKNINFISQYKINIDSNINLSGNAFIDFYLPDLNIFIEYNGEQHYIAKEFFGGELGLEKQKQRDNYVKNYCNTNNIKLIEIKYNDNINIKLNEL